MRNHDARVDSLPAPRGYLRADPPESDTPSEQLGGGGDARLQLEQPLEVGRVAVGGNGVKAWPCVGHA
ncbi:MAG: hypothetical protein QOG69_2598 [Actinomycetota bacterium]|nr:hypothetical protein [Actinomycetota bacterium]